MTKIIVKGKMISCDDMIIATIELSPEELASQLTFTNKDELDKAFCHWKNLPQPQQEFCKCKESECIIQKFHCDICGKPIHPETKKEIEMLRPYCSTNQEPSIYVVIDKLNEIIRFLMKK